MSDLINKYNEQRELFLEALFLFHKANIAFLDRQSPRRTQVLRQSLRKMKSAIRNMEKISLERKRERSKEWIDAHPKVKGNRNSE